MDDMKLPDGMTCAVCAHWHRCKSLICTLEQTATRCDFAPSRFQLSKAVWTCPVCEKPDPDGGEACSKCYSGVYASMLAAESKWEALRYHFTHLQSEHVLHGYGGSVTYAEVLSKMAELDES